jgi:ferredoxin
MTFHIKDDRPYWVDIYLAGDVETAKKVCREHCMEVGLCVTVTPTDFIYTGGQEAGVRVGLVNYPKFPCGHDVLLEKAEILAERLAQEMCQMTALIQSPLVVRWLTRKPEDVERLATQ